MRRIKREGREYVELPDELRGKDVRFVRIGKELYVLGSRDAIASLIGKQVRYMAKRRKERKRGYFWVIEDENEAREFSRRYEEEIRRGNIIAVRGFDGKFYAVRRDVFENVKKRLDLSTPKSVEELKEELEEPEGLVRGVLEILKERGEVYETEEGRYARV